MKKISIAIDGYSSCGKSTMARDLARAIGYIYVDTGAMYRAVTLYALRHNLFDDGDNICAPELEEALPSIVVSFKLNTKTGWPDTYLNDELVEKDIRSLRVSQHVSPVSALAFVRRHLVEQQQRMGAGKGIVMDGRDIGTVVLPNAELKIFVTASVEVRARRRYEELKAKGTIESLDDIRLNVEQRDYIDTHRKASPLRQATDAILIDNSDMTIEQQRKWLLEQYHRVAG